MPSHDRLDVQALVPHAGSMCLWQDVVEWDAQRVVVSTRSHADPANPLRSIGPDGVEWLRALHLCEYGAQAMAVHGGLLARDSGASPRAGMLVALRGVELHVARIDDLDGPLQGEAELLAASAGSQQYQFHIRHAGRLLAQGRAAVMLQTHGDAA